MRFGFLCGRDVRSYPCTRRRPRPRRSSFQPLVTGPAACVLAILVLILLLCCMPQWLCCAIAAIALTLLLCAL